MAAKGLQTDNLKGIGITNQRETTLLWDKRTGKPLHPALVWNDGRTAGVVKRMIEATPTKSLDHLRVSCHNLQ
jgi:glycerol kinase